MATQFYKFQESLDKARMHVHVHVYVYVYVWQQYS
jgi:hypothetical protein